MVMQKVSNATKIALEAHTGQTRKDGTPYVSHPIEVSIMVAMSAQCLFDNHGCANYQELIAAALLHDVLEDCKPRDVWEKRIRTECGQEVLKLVWELTNYSKQHADECMKMDRATRKQLDRDYIAVISPSAKIIKYCDRLHNLSQSVQLDKDFRALYIKETVELQKALRLHWEEPESFVLRFLDSDLSTRLERLKNESL